MARIGQCFLRLCRLYPTLLDRVDSYEARLWRQTIGPSRRCDSRLQCGSGTTAVRGASVWRHIQTGRSKLRDDPDRSPRLAVGAGLVIGASVLTGFMAWVGAATQHAGDEMYRRGAFASDWTADEACDSPHQAPGA